MTVPDTATAERADIATATRVVIKVGSSSLTTPDGEIDGMRIGALAAALSARRQDGGQVVLVSSGAIASGLAPLGLSKRPRDLATQQAAASVGQGLLIARYTAAFARHGIRTGQVLLSADDLMRRTHYRNAQRTLDRLLELGVLPVVNENDTVATDEIRFGDNDRLAALVAHVTRAGALILLSDVDGLYDGDPRRGAAQRITEVRDRADLDGIRLGRGLKAGQGTQGTQGIGGMATKVEAAMIASAAGIPTVVADAASAATALGGGSAGTYFAAARGRRPATRLLWLKHAAVAHGSLRLDHGAVEAVVKRRASLLPAGITGVEGTFDAGDPVNLRDENGTIVARGLVNYDATEIPGLMGRSTRWLASKLGPEYEREVVHRDDLVIVLAAPARGRPRALVVVVAAVAGRAARPAGPAVLQAVEQAASRPGPGLGHAAEDPDQRVLGPVPRFLVGLGRAPDFLADRGAAVVLPARVVAVEDALVLPVGGPVVELGEPDHRERMGGALQLEDLQDAVTQVGHCVVLVRLLAERVRVQLGQLRTAGQLHQYPAGGVQVLARQQPRTVTGQLGLAEPLLQAPDDRRESEGDRQERGPRRQPEQDHQHGAVDRVPGQDVAELVPDHRAELLSVEQFHHAGVDHDERLVPAQRHRVHERRLHDVALGHLGQVQDVRPVPDHLVDVRELALGDPDAAPEVRQPEGPLIEQAEQPLQQCVEPAELAQRH